MIRVFRPFIGGRKEGWRMKALQVNWPLIGALFLNLFLWSGILILLI